MSLQQWLGAITDDTLEAWANKGLLRRGYKLLEAAASEQWQMDAAQAQLDGFTQRVDGVGFEQVQCNCPALVVCHHQVALLLGLRARLADSQPVAEVVAESAAAQPWLITDPEQRKGLLGQPALSKAQRWLAQGVSAECQLDVRQLQARLEVNGVFTLSIPRTVGLAGSVCSCGESRCAHRALVVLQLTRAAYPEAIEETVQALDCTQLQALQELDGWLLEMTTLGMSGASGLFVARGQALATTLLQADLPLPGRMLARLAQSLDDERRSMVGSTVRQVRLQLAELLAYRRALARSPLPQPLRALAGVHRRSYQSCDNLALLCLGAECWTTSSGFSGYSLYFLAPATGRFYKHSDSRSLALNPGWQAQQAFAQGTFCGRRLDSLLGRQCLLFKGWASKEGRLSDRDGSQLQVGEPFTVSDLPQHAQAPAARLQAFAEYRQRWLYRNDPQPVALIAVQRLGELQFDRFSQRWSGEAEADDGQVLRLVLPNGGANHKVAQRLVQAPEDFCLLLGRWTVEAAVPTLYPFTLIDGRGLQQLFCEVP